LAGRLFAEVRKRTGGRPRIDVVREGFEQDQQYSTYDDSDVCAAKINAVEPNFEPVEPGLAEVIDAWPSLPKPVRKDILATVMAATGAG
jgi:hypothetical protein